MNEYVVLSIQMDDVLFKLNDYMFCVNSFFPVSRFRFLISFFYNFLFENVKQN